MENATATQLERTLDSTHASETSPVGQKNETDVGDSPLGQVRDNLQQWFAFWRTRKAVMKGEPVFDYKAAELAERGLMGPWKFNAMQSLISTMCASAVTVLIGFFWPGQAEARHHSERIQQWLSTGFAPFSLMIVANLLAWASLWKQDLTKERRLRAARAYLYYDGAHGFLPQTLLGVATAMIYGMVKFANLALDAKSVMFMTALLMYVVLGIWQSRLTATTFPRKLFALNGYSPQLRRMWHLRKKIDNPGPYMFYRIITLTGVPLVWGVLHWAIKWMSTLADYALLSIKSTPSS